MFQYKPCFILHVTLDKTQTDLHRYEMYFFLTEISDWRKIKHICQTIHCRLKLNSI